MASTSFVSFPLKLHTRFQSPKTPFKFHVRQGSLRPITATSTPTESQSYTAEPSQSTTKTQIQKVPGDYGLPFFGPIKDRLDYFDNEGRDEFFRSRVQKYNSTVFRANMPPGPFIASDSKVIVLLDAKSFPVLFDVSKVEKRDLFTGTYMPSLDLTGGYRILSYLDPSETNHSKLKQLLFFLLKASRERVMPEFSSCYAESFETLERDLAAKGKAEFADPNDQAAFNFLARSLFGADPRGTKLGRDGPKLVEKWVLFQLSPILTLGLPSFLEEPTIHSFRLPSFLVKSDYQRLYDFFYSSSGFVFEESDKMGISREEACHNLLFATCFNSFGGMKKIFPNMLKWVGLAGSKLHAQLAEEIRSAVKSNGGKVTMVAMEQMPLMKSVVYETLRIEPPVPLQYGKAKKDMTIESHDAAFEVKAGEMLFGYQPFATKDPKIFKQPEEFVADRFVGEGEKLLKYVLWSNGPETEDATVGNKQCAGKDFVVLTSRLLLVELFMRYDTFAVEIGTSPLGSTVTLTSLKKASS